MKKKNTRNTKGRIISAAWHLFYEQGYEDTTVDDIIFESQTSKGSFYHYFSGKDSLLSTLSYLFDEKYEELANNFDDKMNSVEKLIFLNSELFRMIEDTISIELLSRLLSSQLITRSEKHLLDKERTYYKLLRGIVVVGQKNGELVTDKTANDIVKAYAMYERALMYDWCLCNGEYSLTEYSAGMLPMFLNGYKCEKK